MTISLPHNLLDDVAALRSLNAYADDADGDATRIESDICQCDIASIGDTTVVAFRGTRPDHIDDWFADLSFDLIESQSGPGRIHRGFAQSLETVYPEIVRDLDWRDPRRILVTGHSKGGGEAVQCAGRLQYINGREITLTTFGCPRATDRKAARWLHEHIPHRRIVHCADVVTRHPRIGAKLQWSIPPSIKLQCCYRHFGSLIYYDVNGRRYEQPPGIFTWADRLKARWRHLGKFGTAGIEHHSMPTYLELVKST